MLKRSPPPRPSFQGLDTPQHAPFPVFLSSFLIRLSKTQRHGFLSTPTHPLLLFCLHPQLLDPPPSRFPTALILGGFWQVCTGAPYLSTIKVVDQGETSYYQKFYSKFSLVSALHQTYVLGFGIPHRQEPLLLTPTGDHKPGQKPTGEDSLFGGFSPLNHGACRMHPPPYLPPFIISKVASNTENLSFGHQ